MKVTLEIAKSGRRLHRGTYEVDDPESFGAAWQDVWVKMRQRWMADRTSVGDLMDSIHEGVIDELNGAEIRLSKT